MRMPSTPRFLAAATLIAAALLSGPAANAPAATALTPTLTPAAAGDLAYRAYEYGIPLMEFLRQARQQTSVTVPNAQSDAPLNRLGSAQRLATAAQQVIVQPNNDTLYTMGHLDLARTALVLHVPRVSDHRYYSFEFLDPYTDVFRYVGTRTTGDGAGNFLITGPGFRGSVPRGLRRIRSAYRRVWLVGRTLVRGAADLPAVHRVQDGFALIPLAALAGPRLGLARTAARARDQSPPSRGRAPGRGLLRRAWHRSGREPSAVPRRRRAAGPAPDRGRPGP